jgi:hypothetical protein
MGYVPKNARKQAAILYVPYKTSWRDATKKKNHKNSSNHALSQAQVANYLPSTLQCTFCIRSTHYCKVQHMWTLCVLHLKLAEQLFAICLLLKQEEDADFMMMLMLLLHHFMECVNFFLYLTIC